MHQGGVRCVRAELDASGRSVALRMIDSISIRSLFNGIWASCILIVTTVAAELLRGQAPRTQLGGWPQAVALSFALGDWA